MNNEYIKLMLTLMAKMIDTAPNAPDNSAQQANTVTPAGGVPATPPTIQTVQPMPQPVQPVPQPMPQAYYPQYYATQPDTNSEFNEIKKMIQMLNIQNTGMQGAPQQTSDDIIANIIAPPLPEYGAEPNGGMIKNG